MKHDAVHEHGEEEPLHVLGHDVVAAVQERPGADGALEREAAADRGADRDLVEPRASRGRASTIQRWMSGVDVDVLRPRRGAPSTSSRSSAGRRRPSGWPCRCSSHDLQLVVGLRVAERRAQEEAVELRLGERERPLVLDRVLGREHEERVAAGCASTPSTVTWLSAIASSSADCVFGIARLISSTSTTFAKIGPGAELEVALLLVVDRQAGHVGRLQVRRALDARRTSLRRSTARSRGRGRSWPFRARPRRARGRRR